MKSFLKSIPIAQRYAYIRHVYITLGGNINLSQKVLDISKNTIYNSLSNLMPTQRIYEKKIKDVHSVYIHCRTIEDPHISGEKLAHELYEFFGLKISGRTVNRHRRRNGLIYRLPIRSVYITPAAAQKRYEFTKFHIENSTNFLKTVFTDESWFILRQNKRWVWVVKTQITNEVLSNQKSHSPKIMIWGGIGYQFKTDLVIIEGTLNSENYIEQIIFGPNLIEEADKKYEIGEWTLMQDNARPHIFKETMCVLNELEINILKDWP